MGVIAELVFEVDVEGLVAYVTVFHLVVGEGEPVDPLEAIRGRAARLTAKGSP